MKRRRVTTSRAWGERYHAGPPETAIEFHRGWVDGAWCVIWRDRTVAQCTDKWMAQLILASITKSVEGGPK